MRVRSMFRVALAFVAVVAAPACLAQDEIFTTNSNSNAVTVHRRIADGGAAPIRVIAGAATGLASPSGIAFDPVHDELIVVNKTLPYSVTVYARTANGNVAPLRTITGALTQLNDPRGVSVDTVHDEIAVANRAGFAITTFARTANGNVAPVRVLQTMGLSNPWGVFIDVERDEIAVANNGDFISVFARTGNGMVAPLRTISGSNTGFNNGPIGIAFESLFDRYAVTTPFFGANFEPAILFFPRTGSGNLVPSAAIGGPAGTTQLSNPNGLAVDGRWREIYVPNSTGNSIAVHQVQLTGNAPPIRIIRGATTQLDNPQFVAIAINLFADGFE